MRKKRIRVVSPSRWYFCVALLLHTNAAIVVTCGPLAPRYLKVFRALLLSNRTRTTMSTATATTTKKETSKAEPTNQPTNQPGSQSCSEQKRTNRYARRTQTMFRWPLGNTHTHKLLANDSFRSIQTQRCLEAIRPTGSLQQRNINQWMARVRI